LAVDDSDFALKALEHLKLDFKREFHFARNGFEAFSKHKALCADRQLYHLILMDLMMPVSDGYEATKMIRDFEMSSGIPRSYICGLSSNEADEGKFRVPQ
jgi:FOG: CheY-like receiver